MPVIQGQLLALPLRIATETPRPELKLIKKLPNESCSSTAADTDSSPVESPPEGVWVNTDA